MNAQNKHAPMEVAKLIIILPETESSIVEVTKERRSDDNRTETDEQDSTMDTPRTRCTCGLRKGVISHMGNERLEEPR